MVANLSFDGVEFVLWEVSIIYGGVFTFVNSSVVQKGVVWCGCVQA